jgi:hypothetical protein
LKCATRDNRKIASYYRNAMTDTFARLERLSGGRRAD